MMGRIIKPLQSRAVVDDIVGRVQSRTDGSIGQGDAVITPVKGRDLRRRTAAVFLGNMNDSVIDERHAPPAISRRSAVAFVQEDVVHIVEKIVDDRPIGVLANEIDAPGNGATGVQSVVRPRRVAMNVHENISFEPGVGAIEVEAIVRRTVENVVDELENGAGPVAARKINGVVEAPCVPKIVVAEDAIAARRNTVNPVEAFRARRRRIGGEEAVLHDE